MLTRIGRGGFSITSRYGREIGIILAYFGLLFRSSPPKPAMAERGLASESSPLLWFEDSFASSVDGASFPRVSCILLAMGLIVVLYYCIRMKIIVNVGWLFMNTMCFGLKKICGFLFTS